MEAWTRIWKNVEPALEKVGLACEDLSRSTEKMIKDTNLRAQINLVEGEMLLIKEKFGVAIWDCFETDKIRTEAEYVKHRKQYQELAEKLRLLQVDWCKLNEIHLAVEEPEPEVVGSPPPAGCTGPVLTGKADSADCCAAGTSKASKDCTISGADPCGMASKAMGTATFAGSTPVPAKLADEKFTGVETENVFSDVEAEKKLVEVEPKQPFADGKTEKPFADEAETAFADVESDEKLLEAEAEEQPADVEAEKLADVEADTHLADVELDVEPDIVGDSDAEAERRRRADAEVVEEELDFDLFER
eukprot:CAMPEP_0197644754 /NCGR_PEP_ID=MMETSP1338-20131121/17623_1 /TAXON_ID=43686 ORGANISM="Pelagodinium beii, Strain RCC1491" /NCGR_SAMPLE_ID=MMETSP1338 /ASSEMBLY_ACC=CAM_ASM_000754 /LENGTH=303 /DNA_ID=CAMNT_0043218203 /DNA_START=35 /DNA_END=946 /DNA_ORIENTATION=-